MTDEPLSLDDHTCYAIYSAGIYVGGGFSLFVGGKIAETWNRWYPAGAPLALVPMLAATMDRFIPEGHAHADWTILGRDFVVGKR